MEVLEMIFFSSTCCVCLPSSGRRGVSRCGGRDTGVPKVWGWGCVWGMSCLPQEELVIQNSL